MLMIIFRSPLHRRQSQSGFSLLEIFIALAISTVLLLAIVEIFNHMLRSKQFNQSAELLHDQLQLLLGVMTQDIQRAGYWAKASNDLGTSKNTNPFMTATTDIQTNATTTCLLLSYDANQDGTLPAVGTGIEDERYGYRLLNGVLQTRPSGEAFDCNSPADKWENLTDPNVMTITQLKFIKIEQQVPINAALSPSNKLGLRYLQIILSGYLNSNPTDVETLTTVVKVRNDKFIP